MALPVQGIRSRPPWAHLIFRLACLSLLVLLPASVQAQAPSASGGVREVQGVAAYEKLPVRATGLDRSAPVLTPIRDAHVEVVNAATGAVFAVSRTDLQGRFRAIVPPDGAYRARVISRSASSGTVVADNTRSGRLYEAGAGIGADDAVTIVAFAASGAAGAFNILETIRRGDAFLRALEPHTPAPRLTLYWSPRNTPARAGDIRQGHIGSTFFNASSRTAFILGDREADADEFDDAVLLHEYAHFIARIFSRDDSIGGEHQAGDILDPRVAWSEGWANFFSAAVRADPVHRDSYGPGGGRVAGPDLEADAAHYGGGYWSEGAVHSLLWDLWNGEDGVIRFADIWAAFRDLAGDAFVYLPSFLDRLAARVPDQAARVEQAARRRFIDYTVRFRPGAIHPFPRIIADGSPVRGEVDSWTSRRVNLARSAHLYRFRTTGGAASIRLQITGFGPAGVARANDLDLVLMDARGRVLARSAAGSHGAPEAIATFLPAGDYVVEVRSFRRGPGADTWEFNSGAYRLEVSAPQ